MITSFIGISVYPNPNPTRFNRYRLAAMPGLPHTHHQDHDHVKPFTRTLTQKPSPAGAPSSSSPQQSDKQPAQLQCTLILIEEHSTRQSQRRPQ